MRILLIADGRSPTTRHWIDGILAAGHSVTLISSYPCFGVRPEIKVYTLPLAFGSLAGSGSSINAGNGGNKNEAGTFRKDLIGRFRSLFMAGRYNLGPASIYLSGDIARFRKVVEESSPDLVHALRIPFEGMLASFTPERLPLVVSIWGNDLILHARGSPWMASLTRRCLRRADGLVADAGRDRRLACSWGYAPERPVLLAPGSGGIDLAEIERSRQPLPFSITGVITEDAPLVVNPRGIRPGSLRTDVFFESIPLVLERAPQTVFLCPAMAGQEEALRWVRKLGIESQVRLLPAISQAQLWAIFHRVDVYVSPSVHDGTPNSFLEALACGCFPVVGDVESFREWITPGSNGLLVDATNPRSMAEGILKALDSTDLRRSAAEINAGLVAERAEVGVVRKKIDDFYRRVVDQGKNTMPHSPLLRS